MNSSLSLSAAEQHTLVSTAFTAVSRFAYSFSNKLGHKHFFTHEDIEDMSQDTVMKAWRSIGSFNPEKATLATWVSRIAVNCVKDGIDYRIKRLCISASMYTKKFKYLEDHSADEFVMDPQVLGKCNEEGADRITEGRDLERFVRGEISRMSDVSRRVAQFLEEGFTAKEIAKAEDCSPNTAAKRAYDMRKALKAALADVVAEYGVAC